MRVVIAYDGSDYATAAVDDLRRSGMPRHADALVISVGETLLPAPSSAAMVEGVSRRVASTLVQARAQASHAMDEASALALEGAQRVHARYPAWEVASEALVGATAPAVMQKAEDWHADLIVVGSQGRSAIGRILGTLSKQVATEARRSVLVARHMVERGDAPVRIMIGVDGSANAEGAVHAVASREWPDGAEARVIAVDDTVRPMGTAMAFVPTAAALVTESNQEHVAKARAMMERGD
jgi:nucleotide-binding universal stress UspA family protein